MPSIIRGKELMVINELASINKEIIGLQKQIGQTETMLNGLSKTVKEMKKNRNKKILRIIPGTNIINETYAKDIVSDLLKIKEEKQLGLDGLREQLRHQQDHFETSCIKTYNIIKKRVPRDVIEE